MLRRFRQEDRAGHRQSLAAQQAQPVPLRRTAIPSEPKEPFLHSMPIRMRIIGNTGPIFAVQG